MPEKKVSHTRVSRAFVVYNTILECSTYFVRLTHCFSGLQLYQNSVGRGGWFDAAARACFVSASSFLRAAASSGPLVRYVPVVKSLNLRGATAACKWLQ